MYEQTNSSLTNYLIKSDKLHSQNIISAFNSIDRKDFVTNDLKDESYIDTALPIGFSQSISQPQVVAFMLELLEAKNGDFVLDIGSGSGYTTALLSKIVGEDGYVIGVERVPELVEYGNKNLAKFNIINAHIKQAKIELGIKGKKFDKILVSAAANTFPDELIKQLNTNGRIVIPIQNSIYLVKKEADKITYKEYYGFSFVPLIF